jgi:hypothetical protein
VSNLRDIVPDVRISIEKLVSPAPDENSGKQKDDHRDGECGAQRRNASLFNHRYHKGTVRLHAKTSTDAFNRLLRRVRRIFRWL